MAIRMAGSKAFLEGDWTLNGATRNIDSLSFSLQQIDVMTGKTLHIDCAQISNADPSGLQLLSVWLECARIRGVVPRLGNVPEKLKHWIVPLMLL